ncbi:MAG: S9 family peptidase [Candidatus Aminicenantaceae bacterium]
MACKILKKFFILILLAAPLLGASQDTETAPVELKIDKWFLLGPFATPLPALHREYKTGFAAEGLVQFRQFEMSKLKPQTDRPFTWYDGSTVQWRTVTSGENGIEMTGKPDSPSIAYLSFYIDVKRWTKAKLTLRSPQAFRICMDGAVIGLKSRVDRTEEGRPQNGGTLYNTELVLETGKHWVLIKTAHDPSSNSGWYLNGQLNFAELYNAPPPEITLDPKGRMNIHYLLDEPQATNVSVSPDGEMAAVTLRQIVPPGDSTESWLELYELNKKRLIRTFRGKNSLSSVTWSPVGQKFSYTTFSNSKGTIWIVDLEAGTTTPLVRDLENLGSHSWSPTGDFLIYSVLEKGKEDAPGIKRLQSISDRQPLWRDRSFLYKITIPDGVRQRLTAGEFTTSLNAISPDGKTLLFTRSLEDFTQRPYSKSELYSLDLSSLEAKLLWQGPWLTSVQWLPSENRLLVLGGPSVFGDIGHDIIEGVVPNEYDTQAYIMDLETMGVECISRDFDPAINQALWCEDAECFFFTATERSHVRLYRYDRKRNIFNRLPTEIDVVQTISIAQEKPLAAYIGSSVSDPGRVYLLNLDKQETEVLADPAAPGFADVAFGNVERWTFKNEEGVEIEGRIYYPPGFDPEQKYPCIVNYYGGTMPVSRSFGGRYPLNLYAAQGYVVYVMQPSGAIGFGQAFSSRHVNDWGIIVADEIIRGVERFLNAHSFVDPKQVGCIGASYGGFMTMLLQTRTNLFTTAIAHAGISSISSYWGEGYWGYSYSAFATANSFPWNRKDLYVNQSPLFNADKISTPLLLLHGSADTNVPPGESTQLYTALKLLGREVEYIQILDQDHHILNYSKRILWTKTILAWFDRWLKRQPEWWQHLYPDR